MSKITMGLGIGLVEQKEAVVYFSGVELNLADKKRQLLISMVWKLGKETAA